MTIPSTRIASLIRLSAAAAVAAATLTGCYIVPMQPAAPTVPSEARLAVAPAPVVQNFTARLYPANAQASTYGMVVGTVTNDLNGRGYFSAVIGNEQFQGEATRAVDSRRDGVANAGGSRGGRLNCRYNMNSPTLGSGTCTLNDTANFTMHVGN